MLKAAGHVKKSGDLFIKLPHGSARSLLALNRPARARQVVLPLDPHSTRPTADVELPLVAAQHTSSVSTEKSHDHENGDSADRHPQ